MNNNQTTHYKVTAVFSDADESGHEVECSIQVAIDSQEDLATELVNQVAGWSADLSDNGLYFQYLKNYELAH